MKNSNIKTCNLKPEVRKLDDSGVAVIITVLFIAFLTSMVLALSGVILPRLRVSAEIKRSVGAIYAADSAIEWCLYKPKNPTATPLSNPLPNGATWTLNQQAPVMPNCSDSGAGPVQAVGKYQGTTRSLQASGF